MASRGIVPAGPLISPAFFWMCEYFVSRLALYVMLLQRLSVIVIFLVSFIKKTHNPHEDCMSSMRLASAIAKQSAAAPGTNSSGLTMSLRGGVVVVSRQMP